jgi:phosphoserine aminotransferase
VLPVATVPDAYEIPVCNPAETAALNATPFNVILVQAYAVVLWFTMTANEIERLSKELSVGIPVTLRVIAPDGLVQIATLPPPVL